MAILLFTERKYWPKSPDDRRFLEVLVALIGLILSWSLIYESLTSRDLSQLRLGLFGAFSSAAFLVPRRTDRIRALAFALMAATMVHPPFASFDVCVAVLSAAAAAVCLLNATQITPARIVIHRLLSPGTILGLALTAMGLYGVLAAYQIGSIGWMLLSTIATLYFFVGTIVVVTRGDWFERHPKH